MCAPHHALPFLHVLLLLVPPHAPPTPSAPLPQVESYLALLEQLAELCAGLREATCAPRHVLPFLQPGRLVRMMPEAYVPQVGLPWVRLSALVVWTRLSAMVA